MELKAKSVAAKERRAEKITVLADTTTLKEMKDNNKDKKDLNNMYHCTLCNSSISKLHLDLIDHIWSLNHIKNTIFVHYYQCLYHTIK